MSIQTMSIFPGDGAYRTAITPTGVNIRNENSKICKFYDECSGTASGKGVVNVASQVVAYLFERHLQVLE